jgi:hypothetical protein
MTPTQKAAMEMALNWLESGDFVYPTEIANALRAALAEQPREPLFKPLIDQHPGLAEELAEQADDKTDMTIKLPPMNDLIHAVGMNPAMLGACYVMHPEALEKVVREAVRLNMAPLSDEQIIKLRQTTGPTKSYSNWADTIGFARAIEAAHGIKGD